MDTPYTWEMLLTIPGVTAATLLIVQYIKAPLDKWLHIPTRLIVLLLSVGLLAGAQAALTGLRWLDVPLIIINGVMAAFAAMGAYESTFAPMDAKKAEKEASNL